MSLRDIQMICMVEEVKTTVSLSGQKYRSVVNFFYDETSSVVRYRKIAAMMCLKLSRIAMFLQEPSRYHSDSY